MLKNKWEIVHDCDMEDGTPTCWAIETGKDAIGKKQFYWIDLTPEENYAVIDHDCHTVLMICKSLASAKRWVTMNLL